ncbi:hypothetical protein ACFVMC_28545 [Nocardia sp. NPDC127579]|uniref:hypothetical protein n=1 Tax=Nocardia sp. NPDC127579 TaxID=3345402 RepID=UPI0036405781
MRSTPLVSYDNASVEHRPAADDGSLDRWLGVEWQAVPPRLRTEVVAHIFGTDLETLSVYAATKARFLLAHVFPDGQSDFEDIAQEAIARLVSPLPTYRIDHWKSVVLKQVQWQVLEERRRRLARKRHPGTRVDFETAVQTLRAPAESDCETRCVDRSVILEALAALGHTESAAVLRATFVLALDGGHADILTTREVADQLGWSQEKVKRLRAAGIRDLRELLRRALQGDDHSTEEAS